MGRSKDVTSEEKEIVNLLAKGDTIIVSAKGLNRDHRTINKCT